MHNDLKVKIIIYFTTTYLLFFLIFSYITDNYEFMYYIVIMTVLLIVIAKYYKSLQLTNLILIGLSIFGLLHIAGGTIMINGTRLYDLYIIPGIFKYDNLVHSFGIFITTFVIYSLLYPNLDKAVHQNNFFLCLILILMAMGVGALNEIMELGAVVFFNAAATVGDYINNAVDEIFNLIGSMLACLIIIRHRKHQSLSYKLKKKIFS